MKKGRILTYDEVAAYAPGRSDEPLVDVTAYSNSDAIIAQYIKMDMVPIAGTRIYVRSSVAKQLALVAETLKAEGYTLKVVYGYRHPSIQRRYFAARKKALAANYPDWSEDELDRYTHNFVAVPEVAGHPTGGAVDVTLLHGGVEVDMGTEIADFSDAESIKTYANGSTDTQMQNRQVLHDAMLEQGFAPFYGEWWHFSYGDQEWAAFYDTQAVYGQIEFGRALITAAGGNGTIIETLAAPLRRSEYEARGKLLGDEYEAAGAEQAGFLVVSQNHFEMAGGEFCGNAARAAAVLLSQKYGQKNVAYTVSGFDGVVRAQVEPLSDTTFFVKAIFPQMRVVVREVALVDSPAWIVDLGGIVHVVIESGFPGDFETYSAQHRAIMQQFSLGDREAVGVLWVQQVADAVSMHPVVWVRAVDTLYYESSCGSGAIAVGCVTGASLITQPSGKVIEVAIAEDAVSLASEMEILGL